MKLGEIGEFGLIERIKTMFDAPAGVTGIGDDCAVIPCGETDLLITTDMLVEGVHFLREDITPEQLGWKAVAVNLSDMAAMGSRATGSFLSIALPSGLDVEWVERFMNGYRQISRQYGVPLLGGDTTSSLRDVAINVAVVGFCPSGTAKLRSSALAGDLICVSGNLGDSGGGLRVILEKRPRNSEEQLLIERHYMPYPQIEAGLALARIDGVHAMMDISDGIASDLRHIAAASGVGARVDLDRLPVSQELLVCSERYGWDAIETAASAGEDYQLLFTVSPEAEESLNVAHTVIGHMMDGSEIEWLRGGKRVEMKGFVHF